MKKIFLATLMAAAVLSSAAQKRTIDHPITKAVLDAYSQILKSDPKDYETYFHRAGQYYAHDEYILAMADVNEALRYVPATDTDMRFQLMSLRANIYLQTDKPQFALADLTEALTLDPTSYATIYLKANTDYLLGNYPEAKSGYQRMIGLVPRSADAYLGLARVAVKESNIGLANDYLEQSVAISPNNVEAYLRRAAVRKSMGNDNGAIDDLLLAMSIDSTNPKTVDALVNYADTNYPAVITGLTNAINQAPKNALYWYLRAQIAQAHGHYVPAIADYRKIIDEQLYNYLGIYASIAECQYYIGDYATALDNLDYALASIRDNASYYVLRSRILRALKRPDEAAEAAAKVSYIDHNSIDGYLMMAQCYVDKGNYKLATEVLGEAAMIAPENPLLNITRAYLLDNKLNQPVAANGFLQQVIDNKTYAEDNVKSLRGFAMLAAGDEAGAMAWIDNILSAGKDHDGVVNYYGACLYSAMGNYDKALQCAEASMKLGYANYYNWMFNEDEPINVSSLRDDLRFMNLMSRYSGLFDQE